TLNSDGSFTYVPNTNFTGEDTFTYRANNSIEDSNLATVTITVNANTPPVAVNDAYTTAYNTTLTRAAPGVMTNDSDVEGDPITAVLVTNVSNGTLTLNANGSFTYIPNAGFGGNDTFTYRVNDTVNNSNVATVTISVNGPPVANNDTYATNYNIPLT